MYETTVILKISKLITENHLDPLGYDSFHIKKKPQNTGLYSNMQFVT